MVATSCITSSGTHEQCFAVATRRWCSTSRPARVEVFFKACWMRRRQMYGQPPLPMLKRAAGEHVRLHSAKPKQQCLELPV